MAGGWLLERRCLVRVTGSINHPLGGAGSSYSFSLNHKSWQCHLDSTMIRHASKANLLLGWFCSETSEAGQISGVPKSPFLFRTNVVNPFVARCGSSSGSIRANRCSAAQEVMEIHPKPGFLILFPPDMASRPRWGHRKVSFPNVPPRIGKRIPQKERS